MKLNRTAHARWEGTLKTGKGTLKADSGAFELGYSFQTRFENAPGTNPEELIGAAHAGCFSMAFSLLLEQKGHPPKAIDTDARVTLEKEAEGFRITHIRLTTRAEVPGIDDETFQQLAAEAKSGCPVSRALSDPEISLDAALV